MNKLTYIITPQTATFSFIKDGELQLKVIKKNDPVYSELMDLLSDEDHDAIIELLDGNLKAILETLSSGGFTLKDGEVVHNESGNVVHGDLGKKIKEFFENDTPLEPLANFYKRCLNNPSAKSVDELFSFMLANQISITPSGKFIGYKKVDSKGDGLFVDNYTGKIDNSVGMLVQMDRGDVNPNRNETCSYGLHVGAWDYVRSFSGDTIMMVLVDPEHVVSVPSDYNNQKMRVCEYQVLQIVSDTSSIPNKGLIAFVHEPQGITKSAQVIAPNFQEMTAAKIKEWALETFNVHITTDNKNKQSIIRQVIKLVG